MIDEKKYRDFLAETKKIYPKFEVIEKKDSLLMKIINVLLRVITFNQMDSFMTRYTTTIGYKVYITESWHERSPARRYLTLFHERIHMNQRSRRSFVFFAYLYLFWPLPVLWAKARRDFEIAAYAAEIVESERNGHLVTDDRINSIVKALTGPQYFWTSLSKRKTKKLLMDTIFIMKSFRKSSKE